MRGSYLLLAAASLAANIAHAETAATSAVVPTTEDSTAAMMTSESSSSKLSLDQLKGFAKNKLSAEFHAENSIEKSKLGKPSSIDTDLFLGVGYKIDDKKSLKVRQYMRYGFRKLETQDEEVYDVTTQKVVTNTTPVDDSFVAGDGLSRSDLLLQYTQKDLFSFLEDGSVTGSLGVYISTPEKQATGKKGSLRATANAAKSFGKLDLSYTIFGQYYQNTQEYSTSTSYTEATSEAAKSVTGNLAKFASSESQTGFTDYRLYNELVASYNLTSWLSPYLLMATNANWVNAQGTNEDLSKFDPTVTSGVGISISPTSNLNLDLSFNTEREMSKLNEYVSEEGSSVTLGVTITL